MIRTREHVWGSDGVFVGGYFGRSADGELDAAFAAEEPACGTGGASLVVRLSLRCSAAFRAEVSSRFSQIFNPL